MPLFSLIATTRGRPVELNRLLTSLRAQTFQDFELILVDQNGDAATQESVQNFRAQGLQLKHVKTGHLPLSSARNIGLKEVSGELVGFPDDDCHYDSLVLEGLAKEFSDPRIGIVCCRGEEVETGKPLLSSFPAGRTQLSVHNLFGVGMSITLFFRRSTIAGLSFDENLGVGRTIGSGEETDLLVRAFDRSPHGVYTPTLKVFHPLPAPIYDEAMRKRAYHYGLGFGVVLRRHFRTAFVPHFFRGLVVRPLGGAMLSLFYPARLSWCLSVLRGRWRGFFDSTLRK